MVQKAQDLFDSLPYRDVVAWTSLIAGHAQQGQSVDALACFEGLLHEGIIPNEVSFLCVLSACYRSGLVIEAEMLFESMTSRYNLTPNLAHYTCMMVGLGYAGNLGKAFPFIEALPFRDDHHQLALLCAYRRCLNVGLGRATFDQIISQ
jgi:pentatricopeptide repeat protein